MIEIVAEGHTITVHCPLSTVNSLGSADTKKRSAEGEPKALLLQKHQYQREQHRGQDSGTGQREAADRALQRTHFVGPGGADHVGGGTQRHALTNGVTQAQQLAKTGSHQAAQNAGDDDHHRGQGANATVFLTEHHTHSRGDGLGQQGNGQLPVQLQQRAQQSYHRQRGDGAGGDACQNAPSLRNPCSIGSRG